MRCTQREGRCAHSPSKPELRRGLWSPDEDEKLINYIIKNGILGCTWSYVAKQAGLQRCGKSCRLRWFNYLRPGLKRCAISAQEEQMIIHLQSILGNRWCKIAACLPGRTDSEVKNYWNSSIKKTLNQKQSLSCTNSVSACSHVRGAKDAYASSQSAQRLDVLQIKDEQVADQNHHEFSIDEDPSNEQLKLYSQASCTEVFTSPCLQAQKHTHQTTKSSACHQLINTWTTLTPHEAPGSANNSHGCTSHIPSLVDIRDSLKGNTEYHGAVINEDGNEVIIDYSSVTASSGISEWSAQSFSDTTDLTDVFLGACNSQKVGISNQLENKASLHEKNGHDESCPTLNSSSGQFRAPASIWANLDQYPNIQARDDNKDGVNLGVPTYINSHGKNVVCEVPQIGEAQDGDHRNCSNNEKAKPSSASAFNFEWEGEAGEDTIWAEDEQLYNIFCTDMAAASSYLDQICPLAFDDVLYNLVDRF